MKKVIFSCKIPTLIKRVLDNGVRGTGSVEVARASTGKLSSAAIKKGVGVAAIKEVDAGGAGGRGRPRAPRERWGPNSTLFKESCERATPREIG